jgi:hypothetical protein
MRSMIAKICPRSWSLTAHGGIEVRRILPSFGWFPGLYRWNVFARAYVGGPLPMNTFGQRPLASGWSIGGEGTARFVAGLSTMRMTARG